MDGPNEQQYSISMTDGYPIPSSPRPGNKKTRLYSTGIRPWRPNTRISSSKLPRKKWNHWQNTVLGSKCQKEQYQKDTRSFLANGCSKSKPPQTENRPNGKDVSSYEET